MRLSKSGDASKVGCTIVKVAEMGEMGSKGQAHGLAMRD